MTASAWDKEEQEREDKGVDKYEGRPQSPQDWDYAVAGTGGQRLHLDRRHGGDGRKF